MGEKKEQHWSFDIWEHGRPLISFLPPPFLFLALTIYLFAPLMFISLTRITVDSGSVQLFSLTYSNKGDLIYYISPPCLLAWMVFIFYFLFFILSIMILAIPPLCASPLSANNDIYLPSPFVFLLFSPLLMHTHTYS